MKLVQRDWEGNDTWFYLTIVKVSATKYFLERTADSRWGDTDEMKRIRSVNSIEKVQRSLEDWMTDPNDIDSIIAELGAG